MTEEHETGTNHIVEVYMDLSTTKLRHRPFLPNYSFNRITVREKRRIGFYFPIWSVSYHGVFFAEMEVSFLPVGPTHEHIDQAFSKTSHHLHHNNAVTFTDLHQQLCKKYDKNVVGSHMKAVANWSRLWHNENVCPRVPPFSHFQYSYFTLQVA